MENDRWRLEGHHVHFRVGVESMRKCTWCSNSDLVSRSLTRSSSSNCCYQWCATKMHFSLIPSVCIWHVYTHLLTQQADSMFQ